MTTPSPYINSEAVPHHINGREQTGNSGTSQAVFNPAFGSVARHVPLASVEEVNQAVAAAAAAFPAWADTPPIRRARVMNKLLQLMNEHRG